MKSADVRGVLEWSLVVGLILGTGAMVRAQPTPPTPPEGPTMPLISPDYSDEMMIKAIQRNPPITLPTPIPGVPGQEADVPSPYWIGLSGGPVSPELRAQLDLPAGQGVIVREVVPDSPAAKAGLEKYDVLLRAGDQDLGAMQPLVELVVTTGKAGKPLSLELLRKGARRTVVVVPAARPAPPQPPNQAWSGNGPGRAQGFLVPFWGENRPFEFRSFGPAVIVGPGRALSRLPDNVSISIKKQDDGKVHITVTRGNDSWDVVGDDPESLAKLPDDIRPVILQVLHAGGLPEIVLPNIPNMPQAMPMPQPNDQQFRQRLDQMEQKLQKMQEKLQDSLQRRQKALERAQQQLKKQQESLQPDEDD